MADAGNGMGGEARRKAAADAYRRGTEALDKGNYDYAVDCYGTCVKLVMDNVMYRQILRGAEYKKYGDNKKGAGALARSKLIGIRNRIKKARTKEDWNEVDLQAEEGLKLNPWDAALNIELGEAAIARGEDYMDVARFAIMCARNTEPENKDYNRKFAEVLEAKGEFEEAAKVWRHICKIDPNDGVARSRSMAADFEQTRTRGGYREATSTQDVAVQRAQIMGKEKGPADAPGMSEEQDLKHAIRKDPTSVEAYLKLAHFYRTNRKLEEAHVQLSKALEVSGGDRKVQEILEDVELDRMRVNVSLAKERAAAERENENLQKQAKELDTELFKRELQVLSRRIETYPQDLALKMRYAELLMRIKKWDKAIPQLQKASQNVRIKGKALYLLGKCFLMDGKASLARGQFERALESLDNDIEPKIFIDCHYLAGRACEEIGDGAAAESHYGQVAVHEYDYRDAVKRMEALQSGAKQARQARGE
jgi:tetratricopeptide (TPR) repeat protein